MALLPLLQGSTDNLRRLLLRELVNEALVASHRHHVVDFELGSCHICRLYLAVLYLEAVAYHLLACRVDAIFVEFDTIVVVQTSWSR